MKVCAELFMKSLCSLKVQFCIKTIYRGPEEQGCCPFSLIITCNLTPHQPNNGPWMTFKIIAEMKNALSTGPKITSFLAKYRSGPEFFSQSDFSRQCINFRKLYLAQKLSDFETANCVRIT